MLNKNQKTYLYPIKVEAHKEGGYYAKCPAMQGAWADGETIEEAVNNIQDVIKSILEYKKEREESKKKLCLI
ncbi:type II toxin-antitoxin system HicB family antitoxin [Patescibacteria group bacterium]|nr:type II toxin-antitoxin system HicB family antitoxin [Patescibacteria group bacterium]MBU1349666.1 type II toxin-antitoxin system HicB family antitoxin [Patescibacteria group bacterium]MBU1683946.1 type II toxin-antitoxin system HicB family antitoxin [Patescibacteria group bacterium]MBU1987576.1 type II toxin-antitoxin system HicB family antitoxin [Patescibacteria group bacterium]MBU2474600.1 type II toxin-antitoxin system HicB family antitoxin [Patescibacteria group bacterium]